MNNYLIKKTVGGLLLLVILSISFVNDSYSYSRENYGAHSMIYPDMPEVDIEELFSKSSALGVAYLRLDVQLSSIFVKEDAPPDWEPMDIIVDLAGKYGIQILGTLTSMPDWAGNCPSGEAAYDPNFCPPADYDQWAKWIAMVVERYKGDIHYWEVWNEPNEYTCTSTACKGFFYGDASEYAQLLSTTYDAIKAADSSANVLIAGVFMPLNHEDLSEWLQEVAENAPDKFDIANIHVRDDLDKLPDMVAEFIEMFSSIGFNGPVWVSEHGYTSDPNYQTDKNYKNGLISQAEYYASSIKDILDNGVDKVFVTLRDNDELAAADVAEGLLAQVIDDQTTGEVTFIEKPSYMAVQKLINASATPTPSSTPTSTPTPTLSPGECEAKSIVAASELNLLRGESEEVTVTVKGDNDCFSEGVTVKAKIKKGKKFIKIPSKTAKTDKNGEATFTITAGNKKGNAKVLFTADGLKATLNVKVRKE
ncbi:MAG: glycosyl hydrolase [Candidatus Kuenenia sp.]|nr:glycosyl hydrolase [Candidatus Kuenenia sp.]